ncbi:MAG: SUMF1/EgtB/PvdO family nonheme iron enzyme [Magnetococcales bacterium]|nr:SUMF1/EgtB/PvdO family nonheme iron enzyme [Magnetococcales bacterium]
MCGVWKEVRFHLGLRYHAGMWQTKRLVKEMEAMHGKRVLGGLILLLIGLNTGLVRGEEYIPKEQLPDDPQVRLWEEQKRQQRQQENEVRRQRIQNEQQKSEEARKEQERLERLAREEAQLAEQEKQAREERLRQEEQLERSRRQRFQELVDRIERLIAGNGSREEASRLLVSAAELYPDDARLPGLKGRIARMRDDAEVDRIANEILKGAGAEELRKSAELDRAAATAAAELDRESGLELDREPGLELDREPGLELDRESGLQTVVEGQAPPCWDKPGRVAGECIESTTGMEFVWVPGGTFDLGKGWNVQRGVPVEGFWLGKYEVTNGQYRKKESGHRSGEYGGLSLEGEDQPVVEVSWDNAKEYADWLSGLGHGKFGLPTEAQWEYAARGGTMTERFWGDDPKEACQYANVHDVTSKRVLGFSLLGDEHACDDTYAVTAPVHDGKRKPNPFGLYDMLGNVWEWTCSWYDSYSSSEMMYARCDGGGSIRVTRGGSWNDYPSFVNSAKRYNISPGSRYGNLGFRLSRPNP